MDNLTGIVPEEFEHSVKSVITMLWWENTKQEILDYLDHNQCPDSQAAYIAGKVLFSVIRALAKKEV